MKKIAIAVAVAAFATATHAAPKDKTWYAGAKLGWSDFEDTGFHSHVPNINNGKTQGNQLGAGVYLGSQHNQYFGFELGYDWFGKIKHVNQSNNCSLNSMGVQLTTRLNYPLTDVLDIYTRLGSIVWHTDVKTKIFNQGSHKKYKISASPVYALGVEYAFTKELATRLDYQWVPHIGDKDLLSIYPDNGMLSVGITYRFNQDSKPVILPSPATIENKRFTLRSDILFEFNKQTFRPEGKVELDSLYSELINLDPTKGRIVVIGYADRIGSPSYNKPLSEKRAHEVMNYLISKGISENTISLQSLGEENPVTGSTCDNIKVRKELINCLAPDRRVNIEIQGTTEVILQP